MTDKKVFTQDNVSELNFNTCKKIVASEAVRIDEPFEVETLEGTMKGKEGDYLMRGIEGEVYVCDAEIFHQSYRLDNQLARCEKCGRMRLADGSTVPMKQEQVSCDGCGNGRYFNFKQDAVEWLTQIPSESIDLIVTDPPYESLEKHRKKGTTTRLSESEGSSNEWFEIFTNDRFPEFFRQCYRVLKPDAHLYVYTDTETMLEVVPHAERVGFKFWNDIIWTKMTKDGNIKLGMGYHWRRSEEKILFFEKGKRKLNNLAEPDVQQFRPIYRGYPTEKPSGLAKKLILNSSLPGELVVDPFCGSGSTGVACIESGRRFIGLDVKDDAIQKSNRDMWQVLQERLDG